MTNQLQQQTSLWNSVLAAHEIRNFFCMLINKRGSRSCGGEAITVYRCQVVWGKWHFHIRLIFLIRKKKSFPQVLQNIVLFFMVLKHNVLLSSVHDYLRVYLSHWPFQLPEMNATYHVKNNYYCYIYWYTLLLIEQLNCSRLIMSFLQCCCLLKPYPKLCHAL